METCHGLFEEAPTWPQTGLIARAHRFWTATGSQHRQNRSDAALDCVGPSSLVLVCSTQHCWQSTCQCLVAFLHIFPPILADLIQPHLVPCPFAHQGISTGIASGLDRQAWYWSCRLFISICNHEQDGPPSLPVAGPCAALFPSSGSDGHVTTDSPSHRAPSFPPHPPI